jgi:hypothetical protein
VLLAYPVVNSVKTVLLVLLVELLIPLESDLLVNVMPLMDMYMLMVKTNVDVLKDISGMIL